MVKKDKNPKNTDINQQKTPETNTKKINVSDAFFDEFKWAFTKFDKLPELKRAELYGNQEYLEQFWEYFKKEQPNLLDKMDKKDLPLYIQALENKWFSVKHITNDAGKLHEEFKPEDTEQYVMKQSLGDLKKFCEDTNNNIPDETFKKFADASWFDYKKFTLDIDGTLKIVDDLYIVWKKFLEKEGIKLWKTSAEHAERILTPNYNPTERVMVTVALTKIRRELNGTLKTAFDTQFSLPIDIFSSYQDLISFRNEWTQFLGDHASEINESLAKKLDNIIVTNGDIQKELLKSWRKFDDIKWFSEREQHFRRIFNKLVTRQLFEETKKTQESIDHYLESIGNTFKEFPPYVNDILNIYPFNDKIISTVDTSFHTDLEHIDTQILDLQNTYAVANDTEKKELRTKIRVLKEEREQRRWQAYIAFLRSKDPSLADVFTQLVHSKFDFSVLSSIQQQKLIDVLIKNKLQDTIKNKVPELLSVTEEELTQFVNDLFDLKKMDISIPTRLGPVPLSFVKKEFLSSARKQLPGINDLEDIQNLPLNFVTQLTESNAAFFEDSPIFDSLYTNFAAKNGKFRLNDAYKIKIKKDGKTVEWYLSSYSPIEEKNNENYTGKELYLYSQPITSPSQERELVTRKTNDGKDSKEPVIIKDNEQQNCDVEILDKKINLNGEAFWALLFGYVLGQQDMAQKLSPGQEQALADKLGKLNVYKEKEEWGEEEPEPIVEKDEAKLEKNEQQKFDEARKQLKWYSFPEKEEQYKDNAGFVPWTTLFIKLDSSNVPPTSTGDSWIKMKITHINKDKWTFTVKLSGGELSLGKYEWVPKELPIHTKSLESIRDSFGNDIYKLPEMKWMPFAEQMQKINGLPLMGDLNTRFWSLNFSWSSWFTYTTWNYKDQDVTHFGLYQSKPINEPLDQEEGKLVLYKIKPNANGTITVSGDPMAGNEAQKYPARDMDYPSFMLFIKEKWLQPKCKEQLTSINKKVSEDKETPTTVRWFSISNIFGFFKNSFSKINDSIKKYDDEWTEDLTDVLTSKGQLWIKIWWFFSPFDRIASSFEDMGMQAFSERDNRIYKKIEKRTKYYEDFDYNKIYKLYIEPLLNGTLTIMPHYKLAALLLVHIKKGKWPYAKDPGSTAKGKRIGALLGKYHQERYLTIREKKIRDLEQNAHIYGPPWADQIKNELVELEMKYIVHVMDGKQMWMNDWDKTKYYFQDKYSKKFCDELDLAYTWFFKNDGVEEWFWKSKDVNFEFARVEYFKFLADRPQQALPYLKVMATKAINNIQWEVFETAVLAGLLSGVFLTMTYWSTQLFIQKICRTRWFIPWLFVKDIQQQAKTQKLLDLFSKDKFTQDTKYNPNNFSFRTNTDPKAFIQSFVEWTDKGNRRHKLSQFFQLIGKDENDEQTLLDMYADKDTSLSDKLLLKDFIFKSNEKNEALDPDVQLNMSSLTWSILTKSQSVVEKMIKFDQWWFIGTWDEIKNMRAFCENMEKAIPGTEPSEANVKFFLEKFFNRFEGRGFTWTKKVDFLKRLHWCSQSKSPGDVEDVLYYSIVGEVVWAIASNNAFPPPELLWALWKWKEFFKKNLKTILSSDVISSSFGGVQDEADLEKRPPQLESWENASILLDEKYSAMHMTTLDQKDKKSFDDERRKISKPPFLNKGLYDLAEKLAKNCSWFPNLFKIKHKDNQKKEASAPKTKATWAKIRNAEVMENVRKVLESKPVKETPQDEYIPPHDDTDT